MAGTTCDYCFLRVLLVFLVLLGACHREEAFVGTGSVAGRVSFSGTAPVRVKLDLSANPTCERQHLRPVFSEDAIVNKNGSLRNTLVWVKSGLPDKKWIVPGAAQLSQDGCVYQPHVLAVMAGQTIEVSNTDPLNHNVHAVALTNAAFNVAQPPRAEKLLERFEHQELMIPITCGVHGWMRAYVSVIAHPFFAVTGEDGAFELKGVPAGTYVLEAVHEKYGHLERQITVTAQGQAQVDFSYTESSR